jgi:hypothetical protein
MNLISQAVKKFLDLNEVPDGLWSLDLNKVPEGHFSWLPCEVCNSNLGGTRFDVEFVTHSLAEGKFTIPVCTDCLTYMESGKDAPIAINHLETFERQKALDKIDPPSKEWFDGLRKTQ